ncbi:MAG: hypothetical protein RLQ12_15865 [Cyclobacteriaceae bacterium]
MKSYMSLYSLILQTTAHFAPEWGVHFAPESGVQFKPERGAQFGRIFHFNHQYTTESIGYSKRWADLFYFHSQGIIDIAVRIFTESQKCALENKFDSIDEDLVHEVVKESFWLEIPAIQALRSGKLKDITQYPDLFFNDDLQENASLKDSHKIKQESCFQTLLECDIPHGYYSDLVVDMVNKYPQYSAEKIVLEIIQQYQKEETTIEKEKSQSTITLDKNYVEGDLRKCNPESEDLHEQLKAKGILLDLRNEGILPLYGS